MKDPLQIAVQRVMPSSSSIVLAYVLAVALLGIALYASFQHTTSIAPMFYVMGGGWLGRAIEKTSLWWRINTSSPSSEIGG
jgi:type IV secretory pathway VirB3-like protein